MFYELINQNIICNDECFKRYIRQNRMWEEQVVMAIIDNLKSDSYFLDIGANIGLTSLFVNNFSHSLANNVKIECFEPSPDTFNFLIQNVKEKNILCHNVGLSDSERVLPMVRRRDYPCMDEIYNEEKEYDVNYDDIGNCYVYPLDSFIYKNISVIKIDVEGHEYEVLLGAKETLEKHKPVIVIEIFEDNFKRVSQLLTNYNYTRTQRLDLLNYVYKPNI